MPLVTTVWPGKQVDGSLNQAPPLGKILLALAEISLRMVTRQVVLAAEPWALVPQASNGSQRSSLGSFVAHQTGEPQVSGLERRG